MTAPGAPRPTNGGSGGPSRVRLAAAAALLVTFVAGVAVGVGAEQWRAHRSFAHGAHTGRGPGGGRGGGGRGDFLRPLNLTPTQRTSVDSILERHRGELERFWSGPGQQMRLIVDSTRNEIRAVLTPAQRATYDSLTAERRKRERERQMGGASPLGTPPSR